MTFLIWVRQAADARKSSPASASSGRRRQPGGLSHVYLNLHISNGFTWNRGSELHVAVRDEIYTATVMLRRGRGDGFCSGARGGGALINIRPEGSRSYLATEGGQLSWQSTTSTMTKIDAGYGLKGCIPMKINLTGWDGQHRMGWTEAKKKKSSILWISCY